MVNAHLVSSISDMHNLPAVSERLYLGSEHCIRAFPRGFEKLLAAARERYPVTLLTPPLVESDLSLFRRYLRMFRRTAGDGDEVVVNDWGAFDICCKLEERPIGLSVGRLFSGQRRGTQRLGTAVAATDLAGVPVLSGPMVSFLKSRGVTRVEIDVPRYGAIVPPDSGLAVSIYATWALNSYTLNCPFTFDGAVWSRRCGRQCLSGYLTYTGGDAEAPFYQTGRAYYTASSADLPAGVDRIVHLRWNR